MEHAFAQPLKPTNADRPRWTWRDTLLVALCLPAVLLALWIGAAHHNWERGVSAVRYAAAFGPRARPPLFFVGGAAGFLLVLCVSLSGGTPAAAEFLSSRVVWVLILLPEITWAGPLAVAWAVLPFRPLLERLIVAPASVRGAFAGR